MAEYDGQDTFFGFVNLNDPPNAEWGPFRLSELRELRISVPLLDGQTREQLARLPIEVEWDEHWQLCPFRKIALPGR